LPSGYIFQQDGAPAHTARATQNWLQTNCPDFIAKDASKFTRLEPLGLLYLGGAMLEAYHKRHPKPKTIAELKGSPAGDLGQPTSGTNSQSCQRVPKATEGLYCS